MRTNIIVFAGMLVLALWAVGCADQATEDVSRTTLSIGSSGRVIVILHDHADGAAVAHRHGATPRHVFSKRFRGFSAEVPEAARRRLADDPDVALILEDREVHATAQTIPTAVERIGAHLSSTAAIDGVDTPIAVDVAVIDSGVDVDHPDLNVVGGVNCNGRGDSYDDENGHGTHVAGTIGALDNDFGSVGVAPGVNIWAVRVLDRRGSGLMSDVICGLEWVAEHADVIDVANMSLGGPGTDRGNCGRAADGTLLDAQHDAICRVVDAGVPVIVAAGNEGDNAANHVPAAYDEVITVSALADFNGAPGGGAPATCRPDEDDSLAVFSNYGPDVDIMAPGVCIYSTYKRGGYETLSGTSMATPVVTGAAALLLAETPGLGPAALLDALLANADPAPCGSGGICTDDPDAIQEPLVMVGDLPDPVCGDGMCNGAEDCESCPGDCGACPECGDGSCNGDETCDLCPADCGACAECGDESCDAGEDCESCPGDCGDCPTAGGMCDSCSVGGDCDSGLCLLTGSGGYCTVGCNVKRNDCPAGSTCVRVTGTPVCIADSGCPL